MAAIGIDLGTTFSGAAVYVNGQFINILTSESAETMPSVVSFRDDGPPLCGQDAVNVIALDPQNTLFDVKRLIGRDASDLNIDRVANNWPFQVLNDRGCIKLLVRDRGEQRSYLPEEISAIIIRTLKQLAETQLQQAVTSAVVTVPAYFDVTQRESTMRACHLADLKTCRLLTEPTAAAMALGLAGTKDTSTLLVYDLGGGTFDISIIKKEPSVVSVIRTGGNPNLGGRDFDNRIVELMRSKFENKHNCDLSEDPTSITRLRIACEKAKRLLSTNKTTQIQVKALHNRLDLSEILTRAEFENLTADLLERTIDIMKCVLNEARMKPSEIDHVLLVGGSTRIPMIKQLMLKIFSSEQISHALHPDLAVMHGAAKYAAKMARLLEHRFDDFNLKDVHPFAIGIADHEGKMIPLIPGNANLPVTVTHRATTSKDNQNSVTVRLYEGNDLLVKNNKPLGQFHLSGITRAPKGEPVILIDLRLNEHGILTVTATEKYGTGISNGLEIPNLRQFNLNDEDD